MNLAVAVELAGNLAAAVLCVVFIWSRVGAQVGGLRLGLGSAAVFCATNVFYAIAYFGRVNDLFEIWDTPAEELVRALQILSLWTLPVALLQASKSVLKEIPNADSD